MNFGRHGVLADQNIHADVVAWLLEHWVVVTAREAKLATATDAGVIRYAAERGLVVVTHDTDLGELAVTSATGVPGVVLLRPAHRGADFTIAQLEALVEVDLPDESPFLVVVNRIADSLSIRLRNLG